MAVRLVPDIPANAPAIARGILRVVAMESVLESCLGSGGEGKRLHWLRSFQWNINDFRVNYIGKVAKTVARRRVNIVNNKKSGGEDFSFLSFVLF
jgi:hypothetical protein